MSPAPQPNPSPSSPPGARPRVSIVIPCYNHARFLAEAIESACMQGEDVEVVVVDDGSTDDSAKVAASHPAVRLVRRANAGLPTARNAGIRASTAPFLVFLDADDRLLRGAIEPGLQALANAPAAAFAFGNYRYIDAGGDVTAGHPSPVISEDPYEAMLRRSFISMHATVIFRRAALEACGGYDESLPACEDLDVYLRILREHGMAQHCATVAEYRRHGTNLSRNGDLIVESAVRVLGRQWQHVSNDPQRRLAFDDGVQFWVTSYANATLWPAASGDWLDGGWDALHGAYVLARHVPHWFARRMRARVHDVVRTAGARTWATVRRFLGAGRAPEIRRRSTVALHWRPFPPPVGHVDVGDLRRVTPVDRDFGFSRGWPIDRHYIDTFLGQRAPDIRGRVLEVKDASYTRRFGAARVQRLDVLDIDPANRDATIVADLAEGAGIPDDRFDCVLLTQVLHLIYEMPRAVETIHRILKPGGVALVTVPGISKVDSSIPWHWSLSESSARRLFEASFAAADVDVRSYGNVLSATAFIQGLASSELTEPELTAHDVEYPVCICIHARKPMALPGAS